MALPTLAPGKNGTASVQSALQAMYAELKALPIYATVSVLPTPATSPRGLAYCGNAAAGQPAVVYNTGTAWKVVSTLATTASAT